MSEWIDRIRNHPVWQELATLGPIIDQAAEREGNEPAIVDSLEPVMYLYFEEGYGT